MVPPTGLSSHQPIPAHVQLGLILATRGSAASCGWVVVESGDEHLFVGWWAEVLGLSLEVGLIQPLTCATSSSVATPSLSLSFYYCCYYFISLPPLLQLHFPLPAPIPAAGSALISPRDGQVLALEPGLGSCAWPESREVPAKENPGTDPPGMGTAVASGRLRAPGTSGPCVPDPRPLCLKSPFQPLCPHCPFSQFRPGLSESRHRVSRAPHSRKDCFLASAAPISTWSAHSLFGKV